MKLIIICLVFLPKNMPNVNKNAALIGSNRFGDNLNKIQKKPEDLVTEVYFWK